MINRKELKSKAKTKFTHHIGSILLILIIVIVGSSILSVMGALGMLVSFVISGSLALSMSAIFLGVLKNKKPVVKDIAFGFREDNILRGLFGFLRFEVFTFLWSLLFIIPGIIKSISYAQMFYLMADNPKMEAQAAQAKSMEIMEGHKWEYFVLQLSFIPWCLLTIITFGVAGIYVVPYIATTNALFYKSLVETKKPVAKLAKSKK